MSENNGNGRWLSPEEAIAAGLADRVIEPARQAGNTLTQNIARGWKRLLAELGVKSGPQPAADRNILHSEAEMRELHRRSSIVAEEARRRIAPPHVRPAKTPPAAKPSARQTNAPMPRMPSVSTTDPAPHPKKRPKDFPDAESYHKPSKNNKNHDLP